MIVVEELLIDDANESKFASHGIDPEQVIEVGENGRW
jgi:hypothetical protein